MSPSTACSARVLGFALLAMLAALVASAADFEHPDFAANTRRPHRVVVLPPQTQIVRARVVDAQDLVKETAQLEHGIAGGSADALDTLGYDGDAALLEPAKLGADHETQALVKDLQDRIDAVLGEATHAPKDVRVGRFTVGEAVLPLASRTHADGFLAIRAQSIVPSKGRRALSMFLSVLGGGVPIPPTNITQGVVVLVDARTGDVAWLNGAQVAGAVVKEPDDVGARLAAALFKAYPRTDEVRHVKKGKGGSKPGQSAPQPTAGDSDDAAAIIAQFEKVAGAEDPAAPAAGAPTTETAENAAAPVTDAGAPPVTEDVAPHAEFSGTPSDAAGAAQVTPDELPATAAAAVAAPPPAPPPAPGLPAPPSTAGMPALAVSRQDGATPAVQAPTGATDLTAIRNLWDVPAAQRPAPTRQVVFQMLEGGPGIVVRNMSEPAVLVSVDLGPWIRLDAAERRTVDVGAGSHKILVTGEDGVEIARASCIVGASALAMAEVWPTM